MVLDVGEHVGFVSIVPGAGRVYFRLSRPVDVYVLQAGGPDEDCLLLRAEGETSEAAWEGMGGVLRMLAEHDGVSVAEVFRQVASGEPF